MQTIRFLTTTLALGLLAASPALAKDKNPYAKPDDSWISISGTAVGTTADSFHLDYGDGMIMVEVDDWDSYGEAAPMIDGDKVTVYGRIDDDLYEVSKIEASSVYVDDLNTYLYANAADEESFMWTVTMPITVSSAELRGTVTSVDKEKREFTIDTGKQKVTVDASGIGYNPVDDIGYQQIDVGDVVNAHGQLDHEFFEGHVLEAGRVTTILDKERNAG